MSAFAALRDEIREAILRTPEGLDALREGSGDHFYGAWHGGSKSEGGGPGKASAGGAATPPNGKPDIPPDTEAQRKAFDAIAARDQDGEANTMMLNPINAALRGKPRVDSPSDAEAQAKDWDRAMGATKSPASVYRGLNRNDMYPGDSFSDPGFMFTTANRSLALDVSHTMDYSQNITLPNGKLGYAVSGHGTVLRLDVPAGFRMISHDYRPDEFILSRGHTWKVTSRQTLGSGTTFITAEPQ